MDAQPLILAGVRIEARQSPTHTPRINPHNSHRVTPGIQRPSVDILGDRLGADILGLARQKLIDNVAEERLQSLGPIEFRTVQDRLQCPLNVFIRERFLGRI
ncbi:hypothetical protein [Ruegeria sp.]|uniref:hypothetical protein n=1 Tax=Ruegeria sp. TaxID=1879320 RepID=UPI003B0086A6